MKGIATLTLATVALVALGAWFVVRDSAHLSPGATANAGVGTTPSGTGGIVVREAALRRTPGVWRLDARTEIELPHAIRAGLDSGVPLEFVLELELAESRRFLPDTVLLDVERRYGLVYYELTRHYRVRSLDDGTARNYRSLGTALVGLGTFDGVPLGGLGTSVQGGPGDRDPARAAPLVARLALRLDGRALPLPLQSPFGSAWRLASTPHVWTLPPRPGLTS